MRPPVLIVEYFCAGGGGARVDRGVLSEARLLLEAVAGDFAALPGVRVLTLVRAGLRLPLPPEHEARIVPGQVGFARAFERALDEVGEALVIAPERDGILLRLTRAVERAGVANLGCESRAVRVASDKWLTYAALQRAGVAQPRTAMIAARRRLHGEALPAWARGGPRPERRAPDLMVKPLDGYACLGVGVVDALPAAGWQRRLERARRLARRHTRRRRLLLQERVRGADASVSLIGDGQRVLPLCLNRQLLRWGERLEYRGGRTGLDHPLRQRAFEAAARSARAIPGLRGYFGIDVVLGDDEVRVIEVNPRLTTSYLGLRRATVVNPAAWIRDAARRRVGPRRLRLRGMAGFSIR